MPQFAQSIAVVIGINAYFNGIPRLETARNDAEHLAKILEEEHGYSTRLLLDEEATHQHIRDLLTQELRTTLGAEDRLFFYFAGHGVALEGDDGPNGYLLPSDARRGEEATYLHMPGIQESLFQLNCRHLLVVLDSCFSGAFRWSSTRGVVRLPQVIHQERYDRYIKDPAWQVITSASHDQEALDQLSVGSLGTRGIADGDNAHSPFALALFEGLKGAADVVPASGHDGVITATELYLYLEHRLQSEMMSQGLSQTPRLWPLPKHDKGEFIFLVPGHELNLPPAPPLNLENNPYLGLKSYDETDTDLFFGRDETIAALQEHVASHALTVVLGASGTGKSSLVKAGLVPKLDPAWTVLPVIRPGDEPLDALQTAIAELSGEGADIGTRVATWRDTHPIGKLVIVVDQFEELVTMTRQSEDRTRFLEILANLIKAEKDDVRVIITLRSDFEPQFTQGPLSHAWSASRYVVRPMTQDELREVIEKPASARVLYFEPSKLVDTLINEVVATPGGLPLLSFALSKMYRNYVERGSDNRAIELVDYDAVGGVVGSLRAEADKVYDGLDTAHQATMKRLMLRMVATQGGGEIARRRVYQSELDFEDAEENGRLQEVVRLLSKARLIVRELGDQGESKEAYVEPAHDALVRAWAKLIDWIQEANKDGLNDLHFQRSLSEEAQTWQQTTDEKLKGGMLWRDPARSAVLQELLKKDVPWMNRRERYFARRSVRSRRRIRIGLAVTGIIIVALAIGALFAANEATKSAAAAEASAREAERERDNAVSVALAIRADDTEEDDLSLLYSAQGYRIAATPEARSAMLKAVQRVPELHRVQLPSRSLNAERIAMSPDGMTLATSTCPKLYAGDCYARTDSSYVNIWHVDGTSKSDSLFVQDKVERLLYSPNGEQILVQGHRSARLLDLARGTWGASPLPTEGEISKAAFSTDGSLIMTAGASVAIWSIDGTPVGEPMRFADPVTGATFYPDSTAVAVVGTVAEAEDQRGFLARWDVYDPASLHSVEFEGQANDVTYSEDGAVIVVEGTQADSTFVGWWDTNSLLSFDDPVGYITSVRDPVLNSDGSRMAVYHTEGSLYGASLWDIRTGLLLRDLSHLVQVTGLTYNSNGDLLVVGTAGLDDGSVVYVDSKTGDILDVQDAGGEVYGTSFAKDRSRLLVEYWYGHEIWDVLNGRWRGQNLAVEGSVRSVIFHPDSMRMITAGSQVQLWDTEGTPLGAPLATTGIALDAAISFDGRWLAVASDQTLELWDLNSTIPQQAWAQFMPDARAVAFSPDGASLGVIAYKVASLRDVATGRLMGHQESWYTGANQDLLFSSDNRLLYGILKLDNHGSLHFLDRHTLRTVDPGPSLAGGGESVTESHDGQLVAAGSFGTVQLWSVAENTWFDASIEVPQSGPIYSMAFSTDDALLAIGARGVHFWDIQRRSWVGTPLQNGTDIYSVAFSLDGTRLASASDAGVTFWDMSPEVWYQRACLLVNRNLSQSEWDVVFPTRSYQCTCDNLPPHPSTNLAECPLPEEAGP